MRRRLVVLGFLLVLVVLGAVAVLNREELLRRYETRKEIPEVATLEDLEAARSVPVGGALVKLGVDTKTPRAGGLVMVYAAVRGRLPDDLSVRGPDGRSYSLGPASPGRLQPTHLVFAQSIPVEKPGWHVIEVEGGERAVASVTVHAATERFHAFLPVGASVQDGVVRLELGSTPVLPEVSGRDPFAVDASDVVDVPPGFELPRFLDPSARPALELERTWPGTFRLSSSSMAIASVAFDIEYSLGARVWVNGAPYVHPHPSSPMTGLTSRWGFEKYHEVSSLDFLLDLGRLEGVRAGDRIGLQLMWSHRGWDVAEGGGSLGRGRSHRTGISNRIDFVLPAEGE
jgi:hypothetical protein